VDPGLGICRLYTYAHALGYGDTAAYATNELKLPGFEDFTGIELPDITYGLIPSPTWKRISQGESWSMGDTYLASVGQGYVISTPLQVLNSAATIANNGKFIRPTILREIIDDQGNVIQAFEPNLVWDLTTDAIIQEYANPSAFGTCKPTGVTKTVEPWVFQKVQEGMRGAVIFGTLQKEFDKMKVKVSVAGKTGTAEYCDVYKLAEGRCIYGNWPTHAWTVAYAPYENPEIVVVAFVYNGGEGASVAAPIVRRMIEAYFDLKSAETTLDVP
jgi:penicillin-binding protein 2